MTAASPETESLLANARARITAGEDIPLDEYRKIIAALRQDRLSAHHASANARKPREPKTPKVTKAAQAAIDKAALLDDLGLS